MSRKKKKMPVDLNANYEMDFLDGDEGNVDELYRFDSLLQGKGRGCGYDIRDPRDEEKRDEALYDYTDALSKALGACANEYIKLREKQLEDEAKIAELGRVIAAPVSMVDSYGELLSELRFARNESEIEMILKKYDIGETTDVLPAAREFARVLGPGG